MIHRGEAHVVMYEVYELCKDTFDSIEPLTAVYALDSDARTVSRRTVLEEQYQEGHCCHELSIRKVVRSTLTLSTRAQAA